MDYETIPSGWNSSRRCGYIFWSGFYSRNINWYQYTADTNGNWSSKDSTTEHRCNCPTKYGPYTSDNIANTKNYTAVCQYPDWIKSNSYSPSYNNSASVAWVRSNTCPKGWGKYWDDPASKSGPYVQCAQGYVPTGYQEPVYGYVTRYRDVYYNYLSTRVAKS